MTGTTHWVDIVSTSYAGTVRPPGRKPEMDQRSLGAVGSYGDRMIRKSVCYEPPRLQIILDEFKSSKVTIN